MRVYLINLDRRPDRLKWSRNQLLQHGIVFERIAAIDKQEAPPLSNTIRLRPHEDFSLTDGELGCFLSHLKTWREFVRTGDEACLILEDDIVTSSSLHDFLNHFHESNFKGDMIHMETYLRKVCLENRAAYRVGNTALHNLRSAHWGAAAYILGRSLAMRLVECPELPLLPVDHLLFDPISPFFDSKRVFQAVPAPCVQGDRLPAFGGEDLCKSELTANRGVFKRAAKKRSWLLKVRREVFRIKPQLAHLLKRVVFMRTRRWTVVPFSTDAPEKKHLPSGSSSLSGEFH